MTAPPLADIDDDPNEKLRSAGGCLGTILTLFMLPLVALSLVSVKNGCSSHNWPTTAGTVTRAWVETSTRTNGSGRAEDYSANYRARVEYAFEVNALPYTGNTLTFNGVYDGDRSKVEAHVAQYVVGKQVVVYYDAKNPRRSVLEPGVRLTGLGVTGGLLFLGLCLLFFRWAPRLRARRHKHQPRRTHAPPAKSLVPSINRAPKCPNCAVALSEGPTPGLSAAVPAKMPMPASATSLHCPACRGRLLLGQHAQQHLTHLGIDAETARAMMAEMGAPRLPCPTCDQNMRQGPLHGNTVDLCLSCGGLWLDEGELNTP